MGEVAASKPLTDTPEFREAVAAAAAAAVKQALAEMMPRSTGGIDETMSALAMSLAQLTDQSAGNQILRVDPAVIESRKKAYQRMVETLLRFKKENRVPLYGLTAKQILVTDLGPSLFEPVYSDPVTRKATQTEVDWDGIPNNAMVAINDEAREVIEHYNAWLGNMVTPKPETALGITHNGRVVTGGAVQVRTAVPTDVLTAPRTGWRGPNAGTYKPTHVLGTVHPPALQTV